MYSCILFYIGDMEVLGLIPSAGDDYTHCLCIYIHHSFICLLYGLFSWYHVWRWNEMWCHNRTVCDWWLQLWGVFSSKPMFRASLVNEWEVDTCVFSRALSSSCDGTEMTCWPDFIHFLSVEHEEQNHQMFIWDVFVFLQYFNLCCV